MVAMSASAVFNESEPEITGKKATSLLARFTWKALPFTLADDLSVADIGARPGPVRPHTLGSTGYLFATAKTRYPRLPWLPAEATLDQMKGRERLSGMTKQPLSDGWPFWSKNVQKTRTVSPDALTRPTTVVSESPL